MIYRRLFFRNCLFFSLCSYTPEFTDKDTTIKLLLAADRLGCTDLKLYVESTIVYKFLDASNATEWVVRSDSHSSPLLKEASMKMYASENNSSVLESEGKIHIVSLRNYSSSVQAKPSAVPDSYQTKKDSSNDVVKILNVTSFKG